MRGDFCSSALASPFDAAQRHPRQSPAGSGCGRTARADTRSAMAAFATLMGSGERLRKASSDNGTLARQRAYRRQIFQRECRRLIAARRRRHEMAARTAYPRINPITSPIARTTVGSTVAIPAKVYTCSPGSDPQKTRAFPAPDCSMCGAATTATYAARRTGYETREAAMAAFAKSWRRE
jgi:hypothetical protein